MPSKITNLRTLHGMGIFADRAAKAASLQFRQHNLIYGFNGSGKSTLSRIFASLEAGAASGRLPTGSSFTVSMDDASEFGCPSKPNGLERRLLVFNSDFVERNLQWAQGKARPVFFIGEDQAKAAAELAALELKFPELASKETLGEGAAKQAEKALATFKRDQAKSIAQRLHRDSRKYEAPQLADDYASWKNKNISSLSEDELKAAEDTRRLAAPMPKVQPVAFDPDSIGKAFQFVKDMCEQTLSTVALDEIQRFPEILLWVKDGYEFHERRGLKDCILCGNELSSERLTLLKGALDNQIDEFIARLSKTAERLQSILVSLDSLSVDGPAPDDISTELRPAFKKSKAALTARIGTAKDHLQQLTGLLADKRERPAAAVDSSKLPPQKEIQTVADELAAAINALNQVIEDHNNVVANFEKHRENAEVLIRKHFIAECRAEFSAHVDAVDRAQKDAAAARVAHTAAKGEADALRQKVKTHGPAASAINKLIASYLGHEELAIKPIEEGYELHRHGRVIDGAPSEGEKTAIAIAYFLSTIGSEDRKLKDLIVVIDDPVSSLDTKALNYACSLIRNRLSGACQVFILTHNQQCLNEFRKHWKNKARPPDGKDPTATMLFIDVVVPEGTQKRAATLVEMSKLLREYESEYHFLFSHVLKFAKAGENYSEYGYMMPNVLRRVLDIFLAFKCPGNSGLPGKIDEICGQYPDLDRDRLSALERLSQVESHSDNLDDLISFSSMALEETRQATDALLGLMSHVDDKHLAALKRICS